MMYFSEVCERIFNIHGKVFTFFLIQTVVCHILSHNKCHQATIDKYFTVKKNFSFSLDRFDNAI